MASQFVPNNWHQQAAEFWEKGNRDAALQILVRDLNAHAPNEPKTTLQQFGYYTFHIGDLATATRSMQRIIELYGEDPETLLNIAVLKNRMRDFAGAIETLERAARTGLDSGPLHDGFCSAYSRLGNTEKAAYHGTRALEAKDRAVDSARPNLAIPAHPPAKNVISFCIWGNRPRYLKGLLRNVLLAPDLYPDWTVRIYHDDSVPTEFLDLVAGLGAELVSKPGDRPNAEKLMWRFLVANDPAVGRFLVRDCDSVINIREQHAVAEWMKSDRPFHVMRDWWTHTDLVLAGMWGGYSGLLPDIETLIRTYAPNIATGNMDQLFLKDRIWPRIARNALVHDRFFTMAGSTPFPDVRLSGPMAHVGQDEHAANRAQQNRLLKPYIDTFTCLQEGPPGQG